MESWRDGVMGRNWQIALPLIFFWLTFKPVLANAQMKSIVIGEGVRGAM